MNLPLISRGAASLLWCTCAVPDICGQTIAEALETTGLSWNHPAGTLVQNDVTFDGVDAVQLSRTGAAALSAAITGPARLELKVRTSTEANADFFEAAVAGLTVTRLSGEQDWQTMALDIPAGSQRVDLLYRKDSMTAHGADAVWVDAVQILPAQPLSIAEAVDANFPGELTVTTASAGWFTLPAADFSAEGGDVLVLAPSPAAATTAAARLRLPLTGRGRLSMSLRYEGTGTPTYITPEFPLRWLSYFTPSLSVGSYVSLEFIQPLNAPVPAVELVIPIPANMMALVDRVRWMPLTDTGLSEALDTAPLPWQSLGGVLAVATEEDSVDGEDAVLFYDATAVVALPLTGPAQVKWTARNSQTFTVDGTTRNGTQVQSLPNGWTRHEYLTPPGAHTLRWQTAGTASTAFDQHGRLDQVTVTPLATVDIPEAADAPHLTWSTAPDTRLTGIAGDSGALEDGDAVRLNAVTPSSSDWVEAAGTGTGRLQFAWGGVMTCAVNGIDALTAPGSADLTYGVVEMPAGGWAARWRTGSSSTLFPGLDAVAFIAGENETLSSIADCSSGVRVVAARGRRAAGPVQDWLGATGRQLLLDGSPALTLETAGSGTLRLRIRAASGATFSWNGGQQAGSGDWQDLDIPVNSGGAQRLTLTVFSGDTIAVDRITWLTGSLFTSAEALETPGVEWTEAHTAGTEGWVARAVTAADNAGDGTAMLVPSLTGPVSADLSATLSGSGWLTFTRKVPSGVTFEVLVNGTVVFSGSSTSGNWRRENVELSGAGPHAITFRASRASGTSSSETGVGGVAILPWAEVDDGAAAEVPAGVTLRCAPGRLWRDYTTTGDPQRPHYLESQATSAPAMLEAAVPGPGWLTFDARGARVLLNGVQVQLLDSSAWSPVLLALPPGLQKVRVTADSGERGGLDNFVLQATAAQIPGEAADQPGWTWIAQGPWNVSVPPALAHDGVDAMVFGGAANTPGNLRTPWPGAGLLSFSWVRPSYRGSRLSFSAGSESRTMDDSYNWRREFVELAAAGGTELVWNASNGEQLSLLAYALLDEVRFAPYSNLGLAEALDTPGRTWTTGTPPWRTLDDGPAPGETADYAVAPPVAGLCYVETAVTHPVWMEYDTFAASIQQPAIVPTGLGFPNLPPSPPQDGLAPGWVRRRVITGTAGPGTLRFSVNNQPGSLNARLLDRVFISEAVSAAEGLDSTLPWQATFVSGEGAGFRLNHRTLVDGDAFVMQAKAFNGQLSTTLTGPGEFSLRCVWEWETPPASGLSAGEIRLGGAPVHVLSSASTWQLVKCRVPAGDHQLSVRTAYEGHGMLLLDDYRFTPGGADEVALALDLPGSYGGAGSAWTQQAEAAATGGSVLRSPENLPAGGTAEASLNFTGSGSLGFAYQFTATESAAFSLLLDGEPFWTAPSAAARTPVVLPVPRPGTHQLTLQWQAGAPGAFAWMDALTLTPFTSISAQEALDTPARTWQVQNGDGVVGAAAGTINGDALRLTATPEWQGESRLFTTVTGPVRVSFRWYRSAATRAPSSSPPTLAFSAPGFANIVAAKVQQWEEVQMDVPSGTVTLEWQLFASSGGTPVSALLDDVRITPVTLPVTLGAALDMSAGLTVTGNSTAWRTVTAPSVQGGDAVLGVNSSLPLTITGSGMGEFEFTCSLLSGAGPAVNVNGGSPPPVETVWRQPGALYGLDLARFRIRFSTTGSRTITLYSSNNAGLSLFDDVTWRPVAALTLAEVLDTPGRNWTTSGTPVWQPLPWPPNGTDAAAGDVAWITGSSATTPLETIVIGAHAVTVSVTGGPSGNPATLKALVNGTLAGDTSSWTTEGLDAETLYLLLPGAQTLRLLPGGNSSDGLSVDSVTFTPDPAPPAWLAGPGVTVEFGQGVWRSFPAGGEVPARSLTGYSVSGTAASLTARVVGTGSLEYFARGGSVSADGAAPLGHAGSWMRHRLELPAPGSHVLNFSFNSGGLADLTWVPDALTLGPACGLTGPALFAPADLMTVLPGGGLRVDAVASRPGLIAAANIGPALFTWWQQAAGANDVTSTGSNGFNLFTAASPEEAGPAPLPAHGLIWQPRRYFTIGTTLTWQLAASVSVGNIRRTPQSVPLAEALDLPAGVTAAEFAPGSAFGYPLASATGGDVAGLRAGNDRALVLSASGPGILTYYAGPYSASSVRVNVGNLPPVDVANGFGHVLLPPGPQTVVLGHQPGTNTVLTVDDVRLLPLPFDPVASLGGAPPLVVTSGTPPNDWPFVLTGGTSGIRLSPGDVISLAGSGPARLFWQAEKAVTAGFTNFVAPPAQFAAALPVATNTLWLDRAATARFAMSSPGFIENCRLTGAPAVTFPEALDSAGLTFTASPGVVAHSLPEGAVVDDDAVAFALGTAPRTLQTQVTGPGRLRFWWRTLTPQANALTCRIGGGAAVSQDTLTWKQADLAVPAGVQTVVWTVTANLASAELDQVQYFPQWTFAAWAAQNTLASLPVADRALDDSDADGVAGLLEFAFGLDPAAADSVAFAGSLTGAEEARGLPTHRIVRALDGRDYLEIQFPRRLNSGLTYQMQATADSVTWENAGSVEVLRPLGADWELCRIRDPLPLDSRPRRLVRLRVTLP